MSNIEIVRLSPADTQAISYIDHLSGKNGHCVGFLPLVAYQDALARARITMLFENGQPGGYLIHGPPKRRMKIYQVCIEEELRRIEFGTALVNDLRDMAIAAKSHEISLHCAEDLEANSFWRALGFLHTGRRMKRKDLSRWQNRYLQDLPEKALANERMAAKILQVGANPLARLLARGNIQIGTTVLRAKGVHVDD